jgi:hypothetical protein
MIKRMFIAILLLALVGGGLVGFNFYRDQMIEQFFANMPVQTLAVDAETVEPITWRPTISTIGTAHAARGVELTVEAAGIVQELLFESNEEVEAGQLLLRLDDAVQNADLEAARTQLEQEELGPGAHARTADAGRRDQRLTGGGAGLLPRRAGPDGTCRGPGRSETHEGTIRGHHRPAARGCRPVCLAGYHGDHLAGHRQHARRFQPARSCSCRTSLSDRASRYGSKVMTDTLPAA